MRRKDGDQVINIMQTADPHEDRRRHFGLGRRRSFEVYLRGQVCARGSRPPAASWCLARSSTFSTSGAIGSRWSRYHDDLETV